MKRPSLFLFLTIILILSTVGFVATDIYLPSFPAIQTALSTTKSAVKLSLSFFLLFFALSQIFYGPLSDRYGRRSIAIFGLLLGVMGTVICCIAPNISTLLAGRIIQALGMGAGATLARAIMRDCYSGDDLAHHWSFVSMGTAVLMAAAPAIGGYIQAGLGWRMNFVFLLLYTLCGLLAVWIYLPETLIEKNPLSTKRSVLIENYLHLLKNPIFIGYNMCACLALAGDMAFYTISPFLFETVLGLSPVQFGWLALIVAAGITLGGVCNTTFVKKVGRHHMLVVGIFIMTLSGALMLVLALLGFFNVLVIMLPMGIYMWGAAITWANSFAGAFTPFAKIAGFAAALYGCFQILGGAIGSTLMAFIPEKNQIPLSIVLLATGVLSYLFQWLAFRHTLKQKN